MSQGKAVVRGPGEGRTLLVGGADYVTMKASGGETNGQFCMFEATSTTPGFGPPLHAHYWAEFFYVLEGEYEFQSIIDGELRTEVAGPGTSVVLAPWVAHTFRATAGMARMLILHSPAGLEAFFEALGEPVEHVGEQPEGLSMPDISKMVEELERAGVHVVH